MGYPMTFQRLLKRNFIDDGGYESKVSNINIDRPYDGLSADRFNESVDFTEVLKSHIRRLEDEIRRINGKWSMLLGDLRRLENDALDEKTICSYVASRIDVDEDTVAIVLKEFLNF